MEPEERCRASKRQEGRCPVSRLTDGFAMAEAVHLHLLGSAALLGHLEVTAEAKPHGGQQLVREALVLAAAVPREEGRGEDVGGGRFLHRRIDRPLPFPAVRYPPANCLRSWIAGKFERAKIEEPGGDDRSPPPGFGNVRQVERELFIRWELFGRPPLQELKPSAKACMRPYSIPLCTILTNDHPADRYGVPLFRPIIAADPRWGGYNGAEAGASARRSDRAIPRSRARLRSSGSIHAPGPRCHRRFQRRDSDPLVRHILSSVGCRP